MKQTAVEWLESKFDEFETIHDSLPAGLYEYTQQAKEMEKQQIFDAYYEGDTNGAIRVYNRSMRDDKSAEEYFNETFKQK